MKTRHAINEDYFSQIDTEDRAYWLGFIAADGCVLSPRARQSRSGTFSMSLQERDAGHLERFRNAVEYSGPLFRFESRSPNSDAVSRQRRISIRRQAFCDHLITHGISPRKTWDLAGPSATVPTHLLRHWWRGFFDGDGTIGFSKSSGARSVKWSWNIGVIGTEAVAKAFSSFVEKCCGVRLNIYHRRGKMNGEEGMMLWTAKVCGVQAPQAVAKLIYEDATVYLDRKKELVDQLLTVIPKRERSQQGFIGNRTKRRGPKNGINTFLACEGESLPVAEWCRRKGLSDGTVHGRLNRGDAPMRALRKPKPHRRPKYFGPLTFNGETLTVPQWAKRLGLNVTTIYFRLNKGETPEQALRPLGKVLFRGKHFTVTDLAKLVNLNRTTLTYRLLHGQTPEEAVGSWTRNR